MPPMLTKLRTSPALSLFVVLLGASVFAWGLGAKLSLYERPNAAHAVPIAKLVQDQQANKKFFVPKPGSRGGESRLNIYNAVALFIPRFIVRRSRQVHKLVPASLPSFPHALFFRPPPANV